MKKILAAVMAAALTVCPFTSAFAKDTEAAPSGRTGGVIINQGASSESYLAENSGDASELPEAYSSVEMGYVTPVKNQGQQNTCIIFSGIAAMESALLRNGYGEYDLSEEHANYWASKRNDGTGWQRDRVDIGAFPYTAYGYLTTGGVVADSVLPYMSRTENYFEELTPVEPLFYAGGIKLLSGPGLNSADFKKAIMENGGVVASFALSFDYFNADTNSSFCGKALSNNALASSAHSALVVGWDDNYPKENFKSDYQPQSNGAWLIKNSWGDLYRYIWVSYEDKYLGADIFGGNYAITDIIKNHTCNELLKVDSYGTLYDMEFYDDNDKDITEAVFVNTFDFSREMPSISSVEFSTSNIGADYTIYYIPVSDGTPTDDESQWTELARGQIPYMGTHNISFKPYTVPDAQGAIGVKITSKDASAASIGCCEWLNNMNTSEYLFLPRTLDNRSFVIYGGESFSLTDYYSSLGDNIGGNFTIRAVANVRKGDVNKDGSINLADAINTQKQSVNLISLDHDIIEYVADLDGSGSVTLIDAVTVQKMALNLLAE
ncbi:MAG: C1 family peptidase [Acutalibacteraceae bacterium]